MLCIFHCLGEFKFYSAGTCSKWYTAPYSKLGRTSWKWLVHKLIKRKVCSVGRGKLFDALLARLLFCITELPQHGGFRSPPIIWNQNILVITVQPVKASPPSSILLSRQSEVSHIIGLNTLTSTSRLAGGRMRNEWETTQQVYSSEASIFLDKILLSTGILGQLPESGRIPSSISHPGKPTSTF